MEVNKYVLMDEIVRHTLDGYSVKKIYQYFLLMVTKTIGRGSRSGSSVLNGSFGKIPR